MAEFADIAGINFPSSIEAQFVLNNLVRQLNERFRELSVTRSIQAVEQWGVRVNVGTDTNPKFVLNRELPTSFNGSKAEIKLGVFSVSGSSPSLLLARGVFIDVSNNGACRFRIRGRDVSGPIYDEITISMFPDNAVHKAMWQLMTIRQSPVTREGTDVRRTETYVVTAQHISGSATATLLSTKLINIGLL